MDSMHQVKVVRIKIILLSCIAAALFGTLLRKLDVPTAVTFLIAVGIVLLASRFISANQITRTERDDKRKSKPTDTSD